MFPLRTTVRSRLTLSSHLPCFVLDNSVSRLEALLPQKNYRALAGSLSDTKKLATELENFKTLDRVSDVQRKVVRLQAECRGAVMEEFES